MKNHKGTVPALLTLGLVLVGSLVTLGLSVLTNTNKIASNPRAATCSTVQCSTLLSGSTGSICYQSPDYYSGTCGATGCSGTTYSNGWHGGCTAGAEEVDECKTKGNGFCTPQQDCAGTTVPAYNQYCKDNNDSNYVCCKSGSPPAVTLTCPSEASLQNGSSNSECSSICGAIGYYGNGHSGTFQEIVGDKKYCCCNKSAANSGGGGDRCCLTKPKHKSCNGYNLISIYSESLSQYDIPLTSCDGDSAYGGTLNLCSPQNITPGCYDDAGKNVGSQGAVYDTSDPSYNPTLCKQKNYPTTSPYACCKPDGTTFQDCRESPCSKNGLAACAGGGGGVADTNPTCNDGSAASNHCIFGTSAQSKGPALCDGNSIRKDIQGCSPAPTFSGACSSYNGEVNKCTYFQNNGQKCAWDNSKQTCIDTSGSGGPSTGTVKCSNNQPATCIFSESSGATGPALCSTGLVEDNTTGCSVSSFSKCPDYSSIHTCAYFGRHGKGCQWDSSSGKCVATGPVFTDPNPPRSRADSGKCDTSSIHCPTAFLLGVPGRYYSKTTSIPPATLSYPAYYEGINCPGIQKTYAQINEYCIKTDTAAPVAAVPAVVPGPLVIDPSALSLGTPFTFTTQTSTELRCEIYDQIGCITYNNPELAKKGIIYIQTTIQNKKSCCPISLIPGL